MDKAFFAGLALIVATLLLGVGMIHLGQTGAEENLSSIDCYLPEG